MARNLTEKCKQCRREGVKLYLKADRCNSPKCAMVKRNFPPGAHGAKGYSRLTGYGQQLREKQKAKRIYRILERQMSNYFAKASKTKGNTEEALMELLEMRFDNVIYRVGFAKSRDLARQLINHNHFMVNGKKVNIPSFKVKVGDVISLAPSSKDIKPLANLKEQLKGKESLSWLFLDPDKMQIKVTGKPSLAESKGEFDIKLIIEFYSK
jgi:small subunit ribosomal protein S4